MAAFSEEIASERAFEPVGFAVEERAAAGQIFLQIVRLSDMKMLTAAGFILDLKEVNRNYMLTRASETSSILNWSEAGIIFCAGEPELWKIR